MTVLIALGIALLSLALIVVAVLALRDDAPRWTLKIKRPGWLLFLGLVAVGLALLVNASRYEIADDVADYVGQEVDCTKVGAMDVEVERRDVYACAADDDGTRLGCFVRIGDTVADVSRRAEETGTIEGVKPDC